MAKLNQSALDFAWCHSDANWPPPRACSTTKNVSEWAVVLDWCSLISDYPSRVCDVRWFPSCTWFNDIDIRTDVYEYIYIYTPLYLCKCNPLYGRFDVIIDWKRQSHVLHHTSSKLLVAPRGHDPPTPLSPSAKPGARGEDKPSFELSTHQSKSIGFEVHMTHAWDNMSVSWVGCWSIVLIITLIRPQSVPILQRQLFKHS